MQRNMVVLGDIHGAYRGVARVVELVREQPPDLFVLVGDLGSDVLWPALSGRTVDRMRHWQASVDRILGALAPLERPVALVPGNHDHPKPVLQGRAINVDGRVVELAGLRLAGLGGGGPETFGLPYEWNEGDLTALLARTELAALRPDVLVSHTPPWDTGLDRLLNGLPSGSTVLLELLRTLQPSLFLCGHIHEAVGHRMLGATLCVNAGRLIWGQYSRYGRLQKDFPIHFQFYRITLDGTAPVRLERVRLSCTGPLEVHEHTIWSVEDRFTSALAATSLPAEP